MIPLLLLLLTGTPDWAKPPPPCCQRTICYEPSGGLWTPVCDGDLLCHGCDEPCLMRYVSRDGGVECEDDSTLVDGRYRRADGGG